MRDTERALLDINGAAEYLNVTPRWVRRAVLNKTISYIKLGLLVRFDQADLDDYLAKARQEAVSGPPAKAATKTGAR